MEPIDTTLEAYASDLLGEPEPAELSEPTPDTPRGAEREREKELSIAIERRESAYYAALVDLDFAFKHLLLLGKRLSQGDLKLRSVLDVSGDFDATFADQTPAAAFARLRTLRRAWRRSAQSQARKAKLVETLEALSLHPQQLRAIDEHVEAALRRLADAERTLSQATGRRSVQTRDSAREWRAASRRSLARGSASARAERIRESLEVLAELEREAQEPLGALREKGAALRQAHRALDAAKNAMVQEYLYMVHRMGRRYANRGVDLGDLLQEGAVGLMRAVDRFDHRRGLRFATYAQWWIRQAFTRTLADHSRTVRLPVNVNEHLFRLRQVSAALAQKLGREPQLAEAAESAGISVERATRLLESQRPLLSLDAPLDTEDEHTLLDRVADADAEDPALPGERAELEGLLQRALSQLPQKEQKVLKLRFGLGEGPRSTLEQIGRSMGVSRERVRQIEARALRTLRRRGDPGSLREYLPASA